MRAALRQLIFRPASASNYSTEALALFAQFTGQPNSARKALMDTFIRGMITSGLWAKRDWICFYAGHDSQGAPINWKVPTKAFSVVGSVDFTTDRGYNLNAGATGNGNYLLMPELLSAAGNNYSMDDASFSIYMNAFAFAGFGGIVTSGANNYVSSIGQNNGTNALYSTVNNTSAADITTGVDNTSSHFIGHWTASRTGPNAAGLYKSGAAVNSANSWTTTTASNFLPVSAPKLLWGDGAVIFGNPSPTTRLAYYSSGVGLTSGEAAAEAALVLTYLTAIGGA